MQIYRCMRIRSFEMTRLFLGLHDSQHRLELRGASRIEEHPFLKKTTD